MASDVEILDCTLRDGSYAVDFRFTEKDMALLCRALSELGFKFIEIGHGLGMSASEAGKGRMPATDFDLLRIARSRAGAARLGMFCIPGIATLSRLEQLAKEGLNFVRVGCEPARVREAFRYLELARKHDLLTMINFMKSYAVSPAVLAQAARQAEQSGAQVVYLVDSAGGMVPEEIDRYISELKSKTELKIGFHGHNNLHLAVANSLQAIRSGAVFVDSTLHGIGRSAGNTPTEVLLAHLIKLGLAPRINLLDLMDCVEKYIAPLMDRNDAYNMTSVAMGYAKFHSSFLPRVQKIAREFHVDEKRLIAEAGKESSVALDESKLIAYAKRLEPKKENETRGEDLVSFQSGKFGRTSLSNTLDSVTALLEELKNVSTKKKVRVLVDLKPHQNNENDEFVLSEYLDSDDQMVLGRIHFGSLKQLHQIAALLQGNVDLILLNRDWVYDRSHLNDLISALSKSFDHHQMVLYAAKELEASYIYDCFCELRQRGDLKNLLVFGQAQVIHSAVHRLAPLLDYLFICPWASENAEQTSKSLTWPNHSIVLKEPADWKNVDFGQPVILSFLPLSQMLFKQIFERVVRCSYFVYFSHSLNMKREQLPDIGSFLEIDMTKIYRGQLSRWLSVKRTLWN